MEGSRTKMCAAGNVVPNTVTLHQMNWLHAITKGMKMDKQFIHAQTKTNCRALEIGQRSALH